MNPFTKEQLQEIIDTDHVQCGDASALARMALAGMEADPVGWFVRKKFMHSHPTFKNSPNAFPPYSAPQPLTTSERAELENYRNAQQVVPVEISREEYKRRFMEQEGFDDTYRGGWNACRAAMLQGKAEQVGKMPDDFEFDRFNDVVWLEAVASNPHMHSLTTSTIAMVALELNRKLDVTGNSPVIPDGWVMVPVEPTEGMLASAGSSVILSEPEAFAVYSNMLAAAPQQEVKP